MAQFFYNPRAQFFDTNGNPLSGGKLYFYQAGTTTPQAIYSDFELTTPISGNPLVLDSAGRIPNSGIWLLDAHYKLVVQDANGVEQANVPDFSGGGSSSGNGMGIVNTINDLRNLESGAYSVVHVQGYYTSQDGGGGWMYWSAASVDADDSGSVFAPNSSPVSGRWLRSMPPHMAITPMMFGAVGNGSTTVLSNLLAMIDYMTATERNNHVVIPAGDYQVSGSLTFPKEISVEICDGAKFSSASASGTIEFEGDCKVSSFGVVFEYPITGLFSGNVGYTDPAWWGVVYGALTDQTLPLSRAVTGTGSNILRPINAISLPGGSATITCDIDVSKGCYFSVTDAGTLQLQGRIYGDNDTTVFYSDAADLITITRPQDVRAAWFGAVATATDVAANLGRLRDAIYTNGGRIVYSKGTTLLDTTYTDAHSGGVPNKISHYVPLGATLQVTGHNTATIRRIVSERYQCLSFQYSDSVLGFCGAAYPEWFGAKGVDGTDDGAALTACGNLLANGGGGAIDCGGSVYYIGANTIISGPGLMTNGHFRAECSAAHKSITFTNGILVTGCTFVETSGAPGGFLFKVVCNFGSIISACAGGSKTSVQPDYKSSAMACRFENLVVGENQVVAIGNRADNAYRSNSNATVEVVAVGNSVTTITGDNFTGTNPGDCVLAYNATGHGGGGTYATADYTPRTDVLLYADYVSGGWNTVNMSSVSGYPANAKIKSVSVSLLQAPAVRVDPAVTYTVGGTSFQHIASGLVSGSVEALFRIEVY